VSDDLPHQQSNQVRQLLAERANADAYGQTTRLAAVDKQLAELGYTSPKQAEKAADAAAERAAAAVAKSEKGDEDDQAARSKPPEGRSTRARATTDEAKAEKKG
jgi:hypothetical protein